MYAEHALACKRQGYTAYKVHANICWNPHTRQPAPQLPGFPKEDVEVCRAVREAVGEDMVLMLDPFGVYTLDKSLWVAASWSGWATTGSSTPWWRHGWRPTGA